VVVQEKAVVQEKVAVVAVYLEHNIVFLHLR
jgi:hypothetical protein